MPAPLGISSPNRNRLKLGQGVKGGGSGLPLLGDPDPTPRPPPGAPPPRLAPAGYATDVTLSRPVASAAPLPSLEGRGAALLRRGLPNIILGGMQQQQYDSQPFSNEDRPAPGRGVSKALEMLKNPDKLFKPGSSKQYNLIMRPGPNVQALIDADPVLKKNQVGLQQHLVESGPVKLPGQDIIKKLHDTVGSGKQNLDDFVAKNKVQLLGMDDQAKQRFSAAVDVALHDSKMGNIAAGKTAKAGIAPPLQKVYSSDIFTNAITQALNIPVNMVPAAIATIKPVANLLTHGTADIFTGNTEDLSKRNEAAMVVPKAVASHMKDFYSPIIKATGAALTGNIPELDKQNKLWEGNLKREPLTMPMDLSAFGGAAAGMSGRVAAATDATRALRAATTVEQLPNGPLQVGGRFNIHIQPTSGRAMVRDTTTNKIVANMPDHQSAIAKAMSLGYDQAHRSALNNALFAFAHPEMFGKTRGAWLDILEKHNTKAADRVAEQEKILKDQLKEIVEDPSRTQAGIFTKRGFKQSRATAKANFTATKAELKADHGPGAITRQAYRELISGVRHGAIYARLGYIPNNWAGNVFMNLTHQGFLAPTNLAKSVVVHNHMSDVNLTMMRKATGLNPAQAGAEGAPTGFVTSAMHPVVEAMGKLADQPFRDAAFLHELRRQYGITKLSDVNALFDTARGSGAAADEALSKIARAGNRAQEEVVKFRDLNHTEKSMATNMLFVWNWVRGSTRYAARYPLQHPIQAGVFNELSPIGQEQSDKTMGGMSLFAAGSVLVGRTKDGNPILINPFALNPLGTTVQVGRAVLGSIKALSGGNFNRYSDSSLLDLTNPVIQEVVKAFTGQKVNITRDLGKQIAPVNLIQQVTHPGSGSFYPTSQREAIGHWLFGSLYPREASQDAISSALERQNANNPLALLDTQIGNYEKATGTQVPKDLIGGIKGDIEAMQHMKEFQRRYADSKGPVGFTKLPPANQLDAALQYLTENHMLPPESIDSFRQAAASPNATDAVLKQLATAAWGSTGVGEYKRQWDHMVADIKGMKRTKPRG